MDKWYINRFTITGAVLILLGILVYSLGFIQQTAIELFYPLLLGSSEGKLVLFFFLMGSLLVLNGLLSSGKIIKKLAVPDVSNSRRYLKYTVLLLLITYITGILIEIWLRGASGVSLFTVFVSLNPDVSTTSIMHSHVFKSALGSLFNSAGGIIPSNIHTGSSLIKYLSPAVYLIFLTLPLTYLTSLLSMDNRIGVYKMIIAFAASLAMIGMIDGGLFSNPAIIGFAGILGMYFIQEKFEPKDLVKPTLIVLVIIIAGLSIEIGGTNQSDHQITLINQNTAVYWEGYQANQIGNDTYLLQYKDNDRNNLLNLFTVLKGKTDAFFVTWNFFSYFKD